MQNKTVLSYVIICTLLLQALLPFLAQYDTQRAASATALSSLFGEKVLLCTMQGFKWVSWKTLQAEQKQEHDKEAPATQFKCPKCYIASHSTIVSVKLVVLDAAVPLAVLRWLPSYTHTALSGKILWQHDRSRAPPVAA